MSWAARRKAMYIGGFAAIVVLLSIYPLVQFFDEEPTCSDGTRNQGELGVDCGGPCALMCQSQVSPMQILWSRAFKVRDGVYNTMAFVENPNFNAAVPRIEYSFHLYDSENVLITERFGTTHIATDGITPIFESGIETGYRIPWRTVFKFRTTPSWYRIPEQPELAVESTTIEGADEEPRIEATVRNEEVFELTDLELMVAVFDESGNAMAGSKTLITSLPGGGERPVFFTWPEPFPRSVGRVDIIPRVPPGTY